MENSQSSPETDNDCCSTSQFSPDGRLSQVEYAKIAAGLSGTAIAMCGKDGVIFAVENLNSSKLHKSRTNSQIFSIDRHIGAVVAGITADARNIICKGQEEAAAFQTQYGTEAPINYIKDKLSLYIHAFTLHCSYRPFGASILLGAYESGEPKLFCLDPSGTAQGFFGCAIGKGAEAAMAQIEKINMKETPITSLVKTAARIIYAVHDNNTDFRLELSWIGQITDGRHEFVPDDVHIEAENYARTRLDEDDT